MAENNNNNKSISMGKQFPVKPKLKPSLNRSTPTPESNYWKSFKSPNQQTLISSITSLTFSPFSPHYFAAAHSATITIFSADTLTPKSTITSFKDTVFSTSFRSDGRLIAASSQNGVVQVFGVNSRKPLRTLRAHTRPVHLVKYPRLDKEHLVSGGDDAVVKYWDVTGETPLFNLFGHKDYVRCGDFAPGNDEMFVTASYDHSVKVWDIRVKNGGNVIEFNHGMPVEDVIYLPSGGLIASAGGNCVKIWDVLGGGKLLYSMESHNKAVTSVCVGKVGRESGGDEADESRILSVGLDGYLKVFDYAKFKVTHSMRFPNALMSVAFSPDCSTRVIGASNGVLYAGKRKVKVDKGDELGSVFDTDLSRKRELKPTYLRYFHGGQNEKPSEGDYLVMRPKKVMKLAEHDKLLKKFRHKEALVASLKGKNPENVVAVMEELVARKKLLKCATNLETEEELGLLLGFLQRHTTMPRYAGLLMGLAKKVVEMRAEDVRASEELKGHIRNLKRSVAEEIKLQQSMQEIQGIISPLLKIVGR